MSEPQKVVWHYREVSLDNGEKTLCGKPWTGQPAGLAVPCEECMQLNQLRGKPRG